MKAPAPPASAQTPLKRVWQALPRLFKGAWRDTAPLEPAAPHSVDIDLSALESMQQPEWLHLDLDLDLPDDESGWTTQPSVSLHRR
jgi:hypothetical protein